jgi:hypothetical protein
MSMQQLAQSDTQPWVKVNENLAALFAVGLYGRRVEGGSGLTFAFYGGTFKDGAIADGTVTLTTNATNYVVAHLTTGTVTASTATTNWNDTATYGRAHKVTVNASNVVTASLDYRFDQYGVIIALAGAAGGSTQGKHSIPIMAPAMLPSATGGCAALATLATSANHPDLQSLDFDSTTAEYAQFSIAMPKSWNEGTVTASFIWAHPATATNFGVRWGLQAVAVSDDDTIDVAYGTAQEVTDTGGTTSDLYRSAETSAITIAGTPAAEDTVYFRVYRDPANGGDTLAVDAKLLGVVVHITTHADTDA